MGKWERSSVVVEDGCPREVTILRIRTAREGEGRGSDPGHRKYGGKDVPRDRDKKEK